MFGFISKIAHNKEVQDLELSIKNVVRENKMVGLKNSIKTMKAIEKQLKKLPGAKSGTVSDVLMDIKEDRVKLEKKLKVLDEQY